MSAHVAVSLSSICPAPARSHKKQVTAKAHQAVQAQKRTLEHQILTPADGPKKVHDDALKADVHITHSHEQRTQTYDLFHMQNQERDNPDEFDLHFQQYMKTSGLRLLSWDERIGNFTSATWCVTLACPSRWKDASEAPSCCPCFTLATSRSFVDRVLQTKPTAGRCRYV